MTRPNGYNPSTDVGPVELRPWPEHDAIYEQTEFPYVLSIQSLQGGALEYIGALHTSDAAEPQLIEIEQRWAEFNPTVALCEGRARMFRFMSRPKSGKLSESELIRILANRNGVRLFTLEPAYEVEVTGLIEHFEPKLVATYLTLRVYSAEAKHSDQERDALALGLMRKRTDVEGLRNTFSTISDLDAYWKETFPNQHDWRTLPDIERVPMLHEVGNISRQIRGEHMVRTIVELVARQEQVIAVVGASHVIRQEPALRKLIDSNPTTSAN